MAQVNRKTLRYEVLSKESHTPGVVVERTWVKSEKIGSGVKQTVQRIEITDKNGHRFERIGGLFRDVDSGAEFFIV